MKITNPIAVLGEDAAVQHLRKKGYAVIDRNYRRGYGEIDIIALRQGILIFIEVKSRTSEQFGDIRESITSFKLKALLKCAEFYKHTHQDLPNELRMDAIFVTVKNGQVEELEHVENITGF